MAVHRLGMSFQAPVPIGNADVEFEVKRNDKVYGTLKVSRGSLVSRPRSKQKDTRKLTWDQVNNLFLEHGQEA